MKSVLVVAGVAPGWVRNQVRVAAEALTEDGRVLIAMSDEADDPEHLPGSAGKSTLFGVARSGYPLWAGRMASVLGLRRRHDRIVLVRFDGDRHLLQTVAALMGRLRGERLVIHDLSTTPPNRLLRRLSARVISALPHTTVDGAPAPALGGPSIALVLCGADTELAHLALRAAQSMSADADGAWRLIVQADDPSFETLLRESPRTELIRYEPPGQIDDLARSSDVVVVRDGTNRAGQRHALEHGAALVLVGHPLGGRMNPRLDGAWLIRSDVSSIIVALEHFRRSRFGGPTAADVRRDGLKLVETVRSTQLQPG
jgi:hypothetical protein